MKIAIYCGSSIGKNPNYVKKTVELGKWMKENGHSLVYGGGTEGLMGIIAKELVGGQGDIIGVLPRDVGFISERPQPYCTEVIMAESMSERKRIMLDKADSFIALPGGIGTLDELSEVITLTKIGVFSKQTICFNVDGFYESFKAFLDVMIENGFLRNEDIDHVLFSDSVEEIENFLNQVSKVE